MGKSKAVQRNVDNVGKAFIAVQNQKASKVFRISCELSVPVDGEILNRALLALVDQFSFYQVEVKYGLLWPYLKKSNIRPVATPEVAPACGQLYKSMRPGLLYDVTYRDNWIHFEVFHALTDGMGASYFMRMLVIAYLMERNGEDVGAANLPEMVGLPASGYEADGFEENYKITPGNMDLSLPCPAYQVKAPILRTNANSDLRVVLDTGHVLDECHKMGVSAAEFLTAIYVKSIYESMDRGGYHFPVIVSIPVNLRKMFNCITARNFFAVIKTRHALSREMATMDNILSQVRRDFSKNIQPNALQANFSRYMAMERSLLRFIPLLLKILVLQLSDWLTSKSYTAILSNLGKMTLPDEYAQYVKSFDLMDKTEGIKLCVISYGSEMSLHFTSALDAPKIHTAVAENLKAFGIPARIDGDETLEQTPSGRLLPQKPPISEPA